MTRSLKNRDLKEKIAALRRIWVQRKNFNAELSFNGTEI